MVRTLLVVFFIFTSATIFAQTVLDVKSQNIKPGQSLLSFLKQFEQANKVKFFYIDEWLEPFRMRSELEGMTLRETLTSLLRNSDVGFEFMFGYAVIFFRDPAHESEREALIKEAVAERRPIDLVVIGDRKEFIPGNPVVLTGLVRDEEKQAPLAGATVYINELDRATTTNATGQYHMNLAGGEYVVSYRFVNRQEKLVNLAIYKDGQVNVDLSEIPITLEEVLISDQRIANARIGETTIRMLEIKRAPAFMGQVDVIKQIQTQPGVTTVSEGTSGFNVRGGGVDQNLVLYDGVPIFNTAHALGFFAAFNADAINEVTFYKGGIPAEFGGRVSSVMNIRTNDGNYEKWTGTGGIGLVSSNVTVGGPVKRDTSSLMVSFRSSYSDWMLNLLKTRYQGIRNGSVFFYDGSAKYCHKIDNRSKLTFSTYTSQDRFSLATDTTNQWQNIVAAMRYDHSVTKNLFYNAGLYFGSYSYRVKDQDPVKAFNLNYKITYPSLKIDFNYTGARNSQSFGFHSTYYVFNPGSLKPASEESFVAQTVMPTEKAIESALYGSDVFNWNEKLQIEAGLRLSVFNRLGPGTVYHYQPGVPKEPHNITDSTRYGAGQIMKTYFGPEPRLSVRYTLDPQSVSIRTSYF